MSSLLKEIVGTATDTSDFATYCRKHIVLDNGQPYDPCGRAAMREIVEAYSEHPHITIEKGAQTGFSTLAIAHTLHLVDAGKRNVIYYLPTDRMASRFGATRFDPYVERSSYLQERLRGTDQAGLKQIGTHFMYVLGLWGKSGAISIPADALLFDEVALLDPHNMELAQDRISASTLGWQRYFSVALFPQDGIDELFESTDKRRWMVRCPSCGREAVVEDEFPENFCYQAGSGAFLVCTKCGARLDVEDGRWVAEHPDRSARRGYRVPQLIIPGLRLDLIWDRWEKAKDKPSKRAIFNRSVLAKPDSGNMQPVSPEVLERVTAASDYYWQDRSDEVTGVGIDMGDRAHVCIAAPYGAEGMRPLAFYEVDVEDLVEVVKALEEPYNVGALVIDAMPYKTESKKVVRSLAKARGYIQYFRGAGLSEGEEGEDDRQVAVVKVDRDESLDETTDLFATNPPMAFLPKPRTAQEEQLVRRVRTHLLKLTKEETGEEDGSPVISYKRNVENHFGMALNSARIALYLAVGRSRKTGPTEYTTVARRRITGKGAY
jgi:hypothetical protein